VRPTPRETFLSSEELFEIGSGNAVENIIIATPATTILSKERDAVKRQKSPRHQEKLSDFIPF
jgi:hypothetical protein